MTALSLVGKGTVVAEKRCTRTTLQVLFPPWLNALYLTQLFWAAGPGCHKILYVCPTCLNICYFFPVTGTLHCKESTYWHIRFSVLFFCEIK
jgi:hypothetical protein